MFIVRGIDPSGRLTTFACGADEQAMDKCWELDRRCFRDITVSDRHGKEMSAARFEQSLGIGWDQSN